MREACSAARQWREMRPGSLSAGVKSCSPVRAGGSPAHWMCEQVGRSAHNTRTSSERSWAPSASLVTMARTWLTHCSRRGPHDFLTLVHGRRTSSSVRRALAASIGGVMGPSEGAEPEARPCNSFYLCLH